MRSTARTLAVVLWLGLLGTAGGVATMGGGRSAECYFIDGIWYCACEARQECEPPECVFIDGEWYCPQN